MRVVVNATNDLGSTSSSSEDTDMVYPSGAFDEEEPGAEEGGGFGGDSRGHSDAVEATYCSGSHRVCGSWDFLNTDAADVYAEEHAEHPNEKEFFTYSDDCTNYVSQLLLAGGMPMLGAYEHVHYDWWTKETNEVFQALGIAPDHTKSWSVAEALYYHLLQTGIARPLKHTETPEAGDLVFFHWSPHHKVTTTERHTINHVGMIVSGSNTDQATEMYTSHTKDRLVNMATEFHLIGEYMHELNPAIPESEDARGVWWQWYILRPIHTEAYVP
jgi:hypothetical protein